MAGGAPEGNNNSARGKRFHKAVERVLARKYGDVDKGYEALAKIYVETAEAGSEKVLLDVIDRSDGKAAQALTDGDGNPLTITFLMKDERVL
jgi:hypothetical protein